MTMDINYIWVSKLFLFILFYLFYFFQGLTFMMMGSAEVLPAEPVDKPVFMEDMNEAQLATAVSTDS